jgi:hypothetical protein
MNKVLLSCGITCAMLVAGCGGSKPPETAKEEAAAPASAPAAIDEANAATVTGKVSFTGEKPTPRTLDMSANPACARAHAGAPPKSEEVVVNGNGTLKNVFVWVKAGLPDRQWPVPSTPVDLAQKGCMYGPHVIGVMAPGYRDHQRRSDQSQYPPPAQDQPGVERIAAAQGRRQAEEVRA